MNNFNEKVSFIWSIADLIRDTFKRGKYQDVILPFTVLRRIDSVLQPTKLQVHEDYNEYRTKLDNLDGILRKRSGFAFYNTSVYDFERLLDDPTHLADNLMAYINGFSENMREVLEKFDFPNTIKKLDEAGLLFLVMERFHSKNINLHPDVVSNEEMGYIFEELIRRFNEALDENPGEHFTPGDIVRLMVRLLLSRDSEALRQEHITREICDPCCGTGRMLTVSKDYINQMNPKAHVYLYGQEVNPETYAVCKADLYLKSEDGLDAENIKFGSTLSNDQHSYKRFDYLLANPPYGKDWNMDKNAVQAEAERGEQGRFGAGLPRISDGQLLFLQHMLNRMNEPDEAISRVGIIMNGSPLFTGDAGSGESEIRRWILENDWLEAIIALPEQLFYNTGIATYVWVLTNRKDEQREGKVQLINASRRVDGSATDFWVSMRKSLGDKRRELSAENIERLVKMYVDFVENEHSRIFNHEDFGYRKITVERPLRLNFQASPERIERLKNETAFQNLAESKKKDPQTKAEEIAVGKKQQEAILEMLQVERAAGSLMMSDTLFKDRPSFERALNKAIIAYNVEKALLQISPSIKKAILSALSERDETAEICCDKKGNPEPDPELRDYEKVPLTEDVWTYFEREVVPHIPDAWIDETVTDPKDGEIGKVGYEINFNRYFYQYQPPRPLEEIEADIKQVEKEILAMLQEVTE